MHNSFHNEVKNYLNLHYNYYTTFTRFLSIFYILVKMEKIILNMLIYVLFNQRGDITTCFTRFHSIFGRLDLTFLEMYQSSRTLYFLDEFLILLSKFQEFCLDLYQPSGMGRRRKRTRKSRSADDEGHLGFFYPVTPSTKQRRNNSRILNDPKENFGTATNINDNVGVTVIMPPGKQKS